MKRITGILFAALFTLVAANGMAKDAPKADASKAPATTEAKPASSDMKAASTDANKTETKTQKKHHHKGHKKAAAPAEAAPATK